MEFQEIHALVKTIKADADGYVNICDVAKTVYGPRTKKVINQLEYDDDLFISLRVKGNIHDQAKWKIHKGDALELILRIRDLMIKREIMSPETAEMQVITPVS